MAELVQAGLEGMLTELEQMQRVELLSPDEVREVVKKRQRFEYKMQKRQKKKEDILAYIQYECALLQLIEIRRDKMRYMHKRAEIDYAIAKRVNKLYKVLEHRFGASGDIKIWMSHLDFLLGMEWKEESSRVVRRLVQTHSHLPQVWIYAARFELEMKIDSKEMKDNPDVEFQRLENSRRLLLEGLRHHSDSREIYREYFCLELLYIEKLHAKEEEEERGKKNDETEKENEVKEGKIAKIVLKQALEDIPEDSKFESELVALIYHFPIAKVRTKLIEYYLEIRGERPSTWDTWARFQLIERVTDDGRNVVDKIEQCVDVYTRAVEKVPTSEMFDLYLTTLFELYKSVASEKSEKVFMTVKVLEAFDLAEKLNISSKKHQKMYQDLVEDESSSD